MGFEDHAQVDGTHGKNTREVGVQGMVQRATWKGRRDIVRWCEVSNFLSDDGVRNIRFALRVPWQGHILSLNQMAVCCLLVFPKNVPEWPSYKEHVETAVHHGPHFRPKAMIKEVLAKFTPSL